MKIHTRALILLIVIFVVVVTGVLSTLYANFQVQKNSILSETHFQITSILQYYFERQEIELTNLLSNHAYWSDVSSHLKTKDTDWIHKNVTQYLSFNKQYEVDLLYMQSTPYDYEEYYGIVPKQSILNLPLVQSVIGGKLMASDFVIINDTIYLVAAAAITQNDFTNPEGILVFARQMDNSILQSISQVLGNRSITKISFSFTPNQLNDKDIAFNNHILKVIYPLVTVSNNGQYAYLSIELQSNQIDEIMKSTLTRVIGSFIVVFSLGILMIYLFFLQVSNHIMQSVSQIAFMTQGNYNTKLNLHFSSEFRQLSTGVNQLAADIQEKIDLLEQHYFDAIGMMAKSIEVSDHYTKGHSERVSYYAVALAQEIGYEDIESIRISGLLHDIGKIAIDSAILNKPTSLNKEEYKLIKKHPEIGFSILEKSNVFNPSKDIVLYHHEHFDGSGYPTGLIGDQIPIGSRILCIADSFDAMTSDRSYRKAIPTFRAIEIMRTTSGVQYDPEMLRIFLNIAERLYTEWHHQH